MRVIWRIGASAGVLLALVWIVNQLSFIRTKWQEYHTIPLAYDTATWKKGFGRSFEDWRRPRLVPLDQRRPSISDLAPQRGQHRASDQIAIDTASRTQIIVRDRVIVVGKRKHEDTNWVIEELPDWSHAIYTVDDASQPLHVPKNKGKESSVYLQYIIDHYSHLPSTIVFLHSHRDGYPEAWHTEFDEHSNVNTVKLLKTDFVQRNGYANLRCNPDPGCPNEIQPFRASEDKLPEVLFPVVWETFFNNTDVPEVVATACCAQFAVSREQVLKRPLSSYQRYQRWLMETNLSDDVSGRIMEYMWHIIFGQDPVYCPDMIQCLEDVYDM
ncbi:hypothetical protein FE257_000926 [Aspergillus nanangensis]|uniref:DUF3431 domain containing protein n=1 Tax=Aspergillus nanangensis TaxID=2582783 RepID=A0AAD4GPZ9_ASPNN|nr:hypothetical protein FE257_000926 [Aspergillus nanangensis]